MKRPTSAKLAMSSNFASVSCFDIPRIAAFM